jgi:O-glycosyl hydrolase
MSEGRLAGTGGMERRCRGAGSIWRAAILLLSTGRVVAGLSSYVPCLPGGGGDLKTDAQASLVIKIDTSQTRQTIRSFGASDAWSAQYVGQWPDDKREAIADLLFETGLDEYENPKGIALSAWRFNLGAGSSRQENMSDAWHRVDTFLDGSFTGYDWSRCPGQRWFLQAAKARGVERFIAFVNSPPINMTKNGLAYCQPSCGTTNLRDDKVVDFAAYLATILKHFRDVEGIDFAGVSPFNEPNWDWDEAGQEGCRYNNSDIRRVVGALHQQLQDRQLDTEIEIVESGDINYLCNYPAFRGDYIDAFFDPAQAYYVGDKVAHRISGHSYFTCWPENNQIVGRRRVLRAKLDEYPGLDYAMTEYCLLLGSDSSIPSQYHDYGSGRDLGIDPALWMARVIHCDLTIAEASDWQWWLGISPYDYKDGLVYVSKSTFTGNYYESKMLWAMGNFSRFIRPGMKRIEVQRSDKAGAEDTVEDLMASAYWGKDEGVVVVVFVNRANEDRVVRLDFVGADVASLIPYVTKGNSGGADNLTAYRRLDPEDAVAIPARSVVTLVAGATKRGDWDKDAKVDFCDFAALADRWGGASVGDGRADLGDLVDWAAYWLEDWRFAAHWKLDETSGSVARDVLGEHDAALEGNPFWRPAGGAVGGALQLDGLDDYVRTSFAPDPGATRFAVFAWVQGGGARQAILSQSGGVNWLMLAPDGTLKTELQSAGRQGKPLGCSSIITDGQWHRVGLAWDGSHRTLYVDDIEVACDAQDSLAGSTGNLSIGVGSAPATSAFWKGLIDDVRIYDRAVTP